MLSGLKFISRDQIDTAKDEKLDDSRREKKKSSFRKGKDRRKKKSSRYSSSDDEDLDKIRKGSRKKKKWYASDEDLSSNDSEQDKKKRSSRKKEKKSREDSSEDEGRSKLKKKYEHYSSHDTESESYDDYSGREDRHRKGGKRGERKKAKRREEGDEYALEYNLHDMDIERKEIGLEWMLRPKDDVERKSATTSDLQFEDPPVEKIKKENPKELNPYLKNNGIGYPEDSDEKKVEGNQLMSSAVVGDGGASWRLKALKRAQEQAAREGLNLEEVVGERWGSLSQLAVSVASHAAAPSRAHLRAINSRRRGLTEEHQTATGSHNGRDNEKASEKDVFPRHPQMRVPKPHDSLTWGKRKGQSMSREDAGVVSSAMASLNKFANDGSFIHGFTRQQNDDSGTSLGSSYAKCEREVESESISLESEKQTLSENQLAAKVLQLRMKGKHEEAEKLLKEAENIKVKRSAEDESSRPQNEGSRSRYTSREISVPQKKKEDDADMYLAQKIVRNQKYSISGQADDEYDYDDGPRRKARKKGGGNDHKPNGITNVARRILTQQERCQFCFENPTRPKHLVVAIANFTYLSLPHWQPVVPDHCCILPMQHESSTRAVDNNVWDEIRNFKKCLIMMFAKQEKDLVFLETVMGLAQQRRHCLVECIPIPRDVANQAPLYFKKAIDEAEDEWSQHNAKKLIDTSIKGLRSSIPKDFPYFHVEFGLNKGFVHVIDDETNFKSNFGLNVIRGMLRLPAEDMHRHRKHESLETQKQAVANFARDWEPFDWTKQL